MKRLKNIFTLALSGLLIFGGCSDSFFDINKSPNVPSEVTPEFALPSAIASSAFTIGGYYQALGGFWSQHYAQSPAASQWLDWESYNLTEGDFDRQFQLLYSGALLDYEYIRGITLEAENWSYYAIATLMQAYTFQVLADLYDKIPFTEALQGTEFLQPKYDDGQDVYEALITRIDDAISYDFGARTSVVPGEDDLVFQGDMDKWIQFGNTLKLKLMLRFVNVDANKYKSEILALLAEADFLDTDATVTAYRSDETGYNPFYNTFLDRLTGNIVANKTLFDFLDANSDDRKEVLFNPSKTGSTYNSVATGTAKDISGTIDNYATPNISPTYPVYFFTQEEVLFLIAEAQQRYGSATDAANTFATAVAASFDNLGATPVTYSYAGLQSIFEQKWIAAVNKRAIESFFDYNRTGYPDFFTVSPTSVFTGNARPKRLFYPQSERNSNPNTPAKVALTEPVWWGK
jgi:hypothetical protein